MSNREHYKKLVSDWDKTAALMVTLENYSTLLTDNTPSTKDLVKVMSITLENIDPEFDIKEGGVITLRAIKEAVKAGAKAAWEILKQIISYLNALYVRFTGSISRVRGNQARVMRRLGKLGSKTSNLSVITVAGVQRLSIDGKFIGLDISNLEDIKNITNYILNIYPRSVTQIARNVSRQFLNIIDNAEGKTKGDVQSELLEQLGIIFENYFREPASNDSIKQGEVSGNVRNLKRSDVLAGNNAFVYVDPKVLLQELKRESAEHTKVIGSLLYMNFSELSLNVADKSEREIDLPSVRDLTDLTSEISRILTLAEKAESGRRDFNTVKTVVDDAIRQIMEKTDEQKEIPSANHALLMIGEISKKLAEPMDNFTHWLAITLNVWLNFIDHCIDYYEAE